MKYNVILGTHFGISERISESGEAQAATFVIEEAIRFLGWDYVKYEDLFIIIRREDDVVICDELHTFWEKYAGDADAEALSEKFFTI